eukprot:CAMPEP_0167759488 /NCGR_PEP_ID=MMETSP0110_2-20121227/11054_1 /TAXON_ID=629695 /ORGANISM="Gymnochlora sp., Strain CCMP2014" /LENGTH=408 /DNA_ID=CAMNT_0007645885 /DNA_START=629 /DNA_END=1855 /DNA_ORIENTATION=-
MLREGKDESARVRTENLMSQSNLATSMEIVQNMCDLLLTRASYIAGSKTCPDDMVEACASVIYATSRMDIVELKDISMQLAGKFSRKFVDAHQNNESGKVNRKLVALLSVKPPAYQLVLQRMKDIASGAGIKWKPKKTSYLPMDEKKDAEEAPETTDFAGTLNVSVLEAKDLYEKSWLGAKKPFVVCYVSGLKSKSQKSKAASGPNPIWKGVHMPFHVPDVGCKLIVEIHNQSSARDEIFSSCEIAIDDLEISKEKWHNLRREKSQKNAGLKPQILLSVQYMSLAPDPVAQPMEGAVVAEVLDEVKGVVKEAKQEAKAIDTAKDVLEAQKVLAEAKKLQEEQKEMEEENEEKEGKEINEVPSEAISAAITDDLELDLPSVPKGVPKAADDDDDEPDEAEDFESRLKNL